MRRKTVLLLCSILMGILSFPIHADARAALLIVFYPGVEFRRANTETWLPIAEGAMMPFGAEDSIKTNGSGRALVLFGDDAKTLLLPLTQFMLRRYETTAIQAETMGRSIYFLPDTTDIQTFEVLTPRATIMLSSGHFAVEADSADTTRIITAEGTAVAQSNDDSVPIPAGYGLRIHTEFTNPTLLDTPAHFARLDATLDGCAGRVDAVGKEALNVRIGPSLDYEPIGILETGSTVMLMATSPKQDRYRIQYLSGFGWILASGVQTDCQNLPVLPYNTFELVQGITQPRSEELGLLLPFFGAPEEDVLFYRIVN